MALLTGVFVSIDSFCLEIQTLAEEFKKAWIEANRVSPETYPYMFPQDNSGTWFEMFEIFMRTGKV